MIPLNSNTHSTRHPDSWYAANLEDQPEFPRLTGAEEADICVIGGGYSGVNTALELAERGYSVILLEAFQIGWGASGRNGGQLIRGIGHGLDQFQGQIGQTGIDTLQQMGIEAVDIVRQRIAKYHIDCDLHWGYCDLANNQAHIKSFQHEMAKLNKAGYRHELRMVDKAGLADIVGSDAYCGGLVDMGSGHLHPLKLVIGEARAAERLGVRIFEYSEVNQIQQGSPVRVSTDQGTVSARHLVICGNAYVGSVHKKLGSKVLPAGSYIIATEPLDDETAHRILPGNMAVCDQKVALDYYRLSKDNRLLFGGLCNYSGRDPGSITGALKPHMARVFPELASVKIDYEWGGMIGIGANRLPQIGRLQSNIFYAQAYSGHGLNASHLAARLIAETIGQESRRIEVFEKVSHMTFPGGRHLRQPLLAAGMMYHRIRELVFG